MYINIETQYAKIETRRKASHSHGMLSDEHLNPNLQLCVCVVDVLHTVQML